MYQRPRAEVGGCAGPYQKEARLGESGRRLRFATCGLEKVQVRGVRELKHTAERRHTVGLNDTFYPPLLLASRRNANDSLVDEMHLYVPLAFSLSLSFEIRYLWRNRSYRNV